jgi:hypothetical protein
MRYLSGVEDNPCMCDFSDTAKSERFLQEFDFYHAIYEELQPKRKLDLAAHLLDVGKHVRDGTRTWVRQDIASWKGLRPPMLMMGTNASDFEGSVERALRTEDEATRIEALCKIRGMGPVLSSVVLMFTWPETCGFIDYHTCSALRHLGFRFPRKYYTSRFTVHVSQTVGSERSFGSRLSKYSLFPRLLSGSEGSKICEKTSSQHSSHKAKHASQRLPNL